MNAAAPDRRLQCREAAINSAASRDQPGGRAGIALRKEIMLERSHIPEARWWVVQAVDKKRERHADYHRAPVPADMLVPEIY